MDWKWKDKHLQAPMKTQFTDIYMSPGIKDYKYFKQLIKYRIMALI